MATGDLSEWQSLSADSCEFCASISTEAAKRSASGTHRVGGQIEAITATRRDVGMDGWHSATVAVAFAASHDLHPSDNVAKTNEPVTYSYGFALTWDEGWSVDSVGRISEPTDSQS